MPFPKYTYIIYLQTLSFVLPAIVFFSLLFPAVGFVRVCTIIIILKFQFIKTYVEDKNGKQPLPILYSNDNKDNAKLPIVFYNYIIGASGRKGEPCSSDNENNGSY